MQLHEVRVVLAVRAKTVGDGDPHADVTPVLDGCRHRGSLVDHGVLPPPTRMHTDAKLSRPTLDDDKGR